MSARGGATSVNLVLYVSRLCCLRVEQWMEVVRVRALSALVWTVLNLLLTGANGRYRCNTYVHLLLRMHPRIYTRLRQAALDGRVLEVE